jgi:hypothetical protein
MRQISVGSTVSSLVQLIANRLSIHVVWQIANIATQDKEKGSNIIKAYEVLSTVRNL